MRRCFERLARIAIAAALAASAPAVALDYGTAMRESQAAVGRTLDDFALTDGDGRRVRIADFRGKPLVVSFIYTGCSQVCPTTTRFLDKAVREELLRDLALAEAHIETQQRQLLAAGVLEP